MVQNESVFGCLGFTPEEIYEAARAAYDDLIDFVTTPAFKAIYEELKELPNTERPDYVWRVLLCDDELDRRGVSVPEYILIQRSTFGDRRPTLFCVKKYLPQRFHAAIENVNITFDNPHSAVIPDGEEAWREPLPVELQTLAMEAGEDPNVIPDHVSVSMVDSNPYEKFDL